VVHNHYWNPEDRGECVDEEISVGYGLRGRLYARGKRGERGDDNEGTKGSGSIHSTLEHFGSYLIQVSYFVLYLF
jgi:hypothetical protein